MLPIRRIKRAEYIEREKLLSHLFNRQDEPLDVMREITEVPAADVAPVRHGKWECLDAEIGLFLCSTCKCKILLTKATYCPNCGARMDQEEEA